MRLNRRHLVIGGTAATLAVVAGVGGVAWRAGGFGELLLFRTQATWLVEQPIEPLLATVQPKGFTRESFEACIADQKVLDGIDWARTRAADKFSVNSTPTFFIDGKKHVGFMSIAEMEPLLRP
jgi:protein-disulfide isomerase